MTKERPILFSGPMVRAILAGQKTQTRRVIKPVKGFEHYNICKPDMAADPWAVWWHGDVTDRVGCLQECQYGKPGNTLWVREQLTRPDGDPWLFAADRQPVMVRRSDESEMVAWAHHKEQAYCPSIHMPRWASRITLEVTGVRVERLNDISSADAKAEGVTYSQAMEMQDSYPCAFRALWHTIHAADGPHGWAANSWVWVVEFKRVTQ